MIIKLHKAANNITKVVNYNAKKLSEGGQIVFYNNISIKDDILSSLKEEFRKRDVANIRTNNTSFHVSINPTKEELAKMDIKDVAMQYMRHMGYGNQPYIVVLHNDIDRIHYHIVSHRIKLDGRKINSSNEIYKSHVFENSLNRIFRKEINVQRDKPNDIPLYFDIRKEKRYQQIRTIYESTCSGYQYSNLFELQKILLDRKIELIEQDNHFIAAGLDNTGRKTKSIVVDSQKIKPIMKKTLTFTNRERTKNLMKFVLEISMSEIHARRILAKKGIGIQFLKNNGQIYGVYFIDHINKIIVTASEVSKDISAKKWEEIRIGKWKAYEDRLKNIKPDFSPQNTTRLYNCLSKQYASLFLYNPWESTNESFKDLKYSYSRNNQKRII